MLSVCKIKCYNCICIRRKCWFNCSPTYITDGSISTYSTSLPKNVWNLKKSGKYSFEGHTETSALYTNSNYLFTGASKVQITVYNNSSKYNVKYQLKEDKFGIKKVVATGYTAEGEGLRLFIEVNIDAYGKYYIRFPATCDFYGYIEVI